MKYFGSGIIFNVKKNYAKIFFSFKFKEKLFFKCVVFIKRYVE